MKTIHLFAEVTDSGLKRKRRSENPQKRSRETCIATLLNQPDNYWSITPKDPAIEDDYDR